MNASDITALLDATASLTSAGIHAESSIFATPSTAAEINRAVMEWCASNGATVEVRPRWNNIRVGEFIVAVVYRSPEAVEEPKRVVEVPLEVTP